MNIESLQSLSHDAEIIMFELSGYNKSNLFETFYFTANDNVVFDGKAYLPLACAIEGLEITTQGQLPNPTLSVSDCTTENSQIITGLIDYYGGLEGSTVVIKQVLRKNLDDGTAPNPAKLKPVQKFQVSQMKTMVPGIGVTFELTTPLELLDTKLPVQVCLNKCNARYRNLLECGYTGTAEWNVAGQPVANGAPDAACGKTIAACKLRFGATAVLPILAFPALTRIG